MIPVLFVGDGARDSAMLPPIVSTILGKTVRPESRNWARLHAAGRGYDRKLLFAFAVARADDLVAVVATVDSDKTGRDRLAEMHAARAKDRAKKPALPTALGCAEPHAEAWLLDDPTAIRTALDLPPAHALPSVRQSNNPKAVLDEAMSATGTSRYLDLIALIAGALVPTRCGHKKDTGFDAFEQDVTAELGNL